MEHQSLDSARKGFIKALEKEGYGEKNIEYQNAQGQLNLTLSKGTKAKIQQLSMLSGESMASYVLEDVYKRQPITKLIAFFAIFINLFLKPNTPISG